MRHQRKSGLIFLTTALSMISWGWAYNLDQVLSRLDNKEKGIKAIQFDFKQEIDFIGSDMKSEVEGQALFEKPGKLKISKRKPDEQMTISDGKKIWVYTPAYNQIWEGRWKTWVNNQMIPTGLFPFNDFVHELRQYFNLSLKSDDKEATEVQIVAVPKDSLRGYRLMVYLSTETWFPHKTVYTSESATITTSIDRVEVNPSLPKGTFIFLPPKGAEIISMN
ncbi:MAG: outer membrane lipoprotein carrier protein LolA [Elusimicrobia bacterium]|nr:outer membrane lipoprotein carrier protein LolA [Candidatus Obscuribacterium magneticum]